MRRGTARHKYAAARGERGAKKATRCASSAGGIESPAVVEDDKDDDEATSVLSAADTTVAVAVAEADAEADADEATVLVDRVRAAAAAAPACDLPNTPPMFCCCILRACR